MKRTILSTEQKNEKSLVLDLYEGKEIFLNNDARDVKDIVVKAGYGEADKKENVQPAIKVWHCQDL